MKIATATLTSTAPYSQSRAYSEEIEKLPKETPDAYEARTWRHKCHSLADGRLYIPPMAFKMAVDTAAKMLSRKIPGQRNATYTKFFRSGVLVMEPAALDVRQDEIPCDRIFANADGVRGSGKRVWRLFPRVDAWRADVAFHVIADEITPEVFEDHLRQSGAFVGIGRFRPENGGFYGRFEVKKIVWN